MNKVERLISIVMILLQREVMSATAFSDLFGVSKRTILRDMETLGLANIPIYAIHGVHGGYAIMDTYKLDKRLLSHTDLEHVLTALSGLEQLLVSREVESTVRKIESMVSAVTRKEVVQLSFYHWQGRSELLPVLDLCQQAIVQNRLVSFAYLDRRGIATDRTVEPYRLHFSERSWYLKGFCLERQAYRTFKLTRAEHFRLQEGRFVPRDDSSEEMREEDYRSQLVAVKMQISPLVREHFVERYGRKCMDDSDPECLIASIEVPQDEEGFRFIAGFGAAVKILEPSSYVEQFMAFLEGMMQVYRRKERKE
ncbi:helix-turn-helix transcriptional regulator [Paenibacillus sp. 1P07SE]|uniref:helix-turn-helix transcriptional regulator n=1 Tax=Paenibacillus sp. 1P07SE TaxID=3132209 RepID=UPI0039A67F98